MGVNLRFRDFRSQRDGADRNDDCDARYLHDGKDDGVGKGIEIATATPARRIF